MPRFQTVLGSEEGGAALFVEVPTEVIAALGSLKLPAVKVALNGFQYRTTVAVYGNRYYLPVRREIREGAGLVVGEPVDVIVELDSAPRVVDIPDDLRQALDADLEVREAFDNLSYAHRKEYVSWIVEAKREVTRRARISRAVAMVREDKREP